jgi:hypothetical protein
MRSENKFWMNLKKNKNKLQLIYLVSIALITIVYYCLLYIFWGILNKQVRTKKRYIYLHIYNSYKKEKITIRAQIINRYK